MKQVTIRVGNAESRIEGGVLEAACAAAISESCSFMPAGAEFMARQHRYGKSRYGNWDGKKRLYHKGFRKFQTGLLPRICGILNDFGYEVVTTYEGDDVDVGIGLRPMPSEWAMRDYQRRAVRTMLDEQRGMVKVATGGGKTVIAGHVVRALNVRAVFLVHTKDLLYQAIGTFNSMFGCDRVGQIGDGVVSPNDITVCTLQTAARALGAEYEKDATSEGEDAWLDKDTPAELQSGLICRTLDQAQLVFMDECHRVAAPTAAAVVTSIKNARYRFGLSASPWRDDGADLQLEAIFGSVIVDINASSLINQGHLVTPYIEIKQVPPGRFPKGTKYSQIYEQYIVNNDYRNDMVVNDAAVKIRNCLPTMVLVRQIVHGNTIRDKLSATLGFDVPFLSGKDDSTTRNSVIQDLRDSRLRALVATTIADEGLDIKPLAGLVLAGGGKSSTRALQRVGRVLRPYPGKEHACITDFEDNAKYLDQHSAARRHIYESEPRFIIV